jgi:hypothetical protein
MACNPKRGRNELGSSICAANIIPVRSLVEDSDKHERLRCGSNANRPGMASHWDWRF